MPRPTTVNELLKAAKEVIATEDRWTIGSLESLDGRCHCALGAVFVAAGLPCFTPLNSGLVAERNFEPDPKTEREAYEMVRRLAEASPYDVAGRFNSTLVWETNDRLGFAATHEMFDKAIAATEVAA
jgi:hypothetical protein